MINDDIVINYMLYKNCLYNEKSNINLILMLKIRLRDLPSVRNFYITMN